MRYKGCFITQESRISFLLLVNPSSLIEVREKLSLDHFVEIQLQLLIWKPDVFSKQMFSRMVIFPPTSQRYSAFIKLFCHSLRNVNHYKKQLWELCYLWLHEMLFTDVLKERVLFPLSLQENRSWFFSKDKNWVTNRRKRGGFDWINLVLNQALKLETAGFRDICH